MESFKGRTCCCCKKKAKFSDETPVGLRHFCSERHWAEYNGLEVMAEGHYGMIQTKVGWWA